ncbi:MAG: NAD-binding protein [Chitinophagales bacterium]|nr:NAD-binding protein [Saprospirales bacterium]MBP6659043.1 NAD-binding protein [Chitinophagales bacterium]
MQKPTLKEKFRYYFENTMSSGPSGVIKWLAIVSLAIVLLLGLVILIFGIKESGDAESPLGFFEGAWQSLMATLDSGTMGGDPADAWPFRIVRFIATLVGIFVISILIGSISSGIDEKIDELKKGKSKVLETNHTLILGWSEKVFSIIKEIIEANSNQKNPSIVILADRDKVEMDDEIREKIEDFKNTKIICRSGSPLESSAINVVNPNAARSIIVLANEEANADTYVIKSVLALTNGKNRKKEAYHIVAEVKDPKNMEAAELVGNNETVFVLSSNLISKITAQTCRQSGLSVVYTELLQFDGDEIYFNEEKSLAGKTYKDALFAYNTSSIIGLFTSDKNVLINPPMDTVINNGDQVIAISEDDDTVKISGMSSWNIKHDVFNNFEKDDVKTEHSLILGWNNRGTSIIEELDNYVAKGSEVLILADSEIDIEASLTDLKANVKNQNISYMKGNIIDRNTLDSLRVENFDHIILLSYKDGMDVQESDAITLICLLHLRAISEKVNKDFSIVSEMLDIRNRDLGVVAKADDFIVGDNLISLMLSQLSENKDLKKVYDILFDADGSEIYLKPVSRYVKTGEEMDFYTIVERAAQLNETAIGYRVTAESSNSDEHFGVRLNPKKTDKFTFSPDDLIIVLSED